LRGAGAPLGRLIPYWGRGEGELRAKQKMIQGGRGGNRYQTRGGGRGGG